MTILLPILVLYFLLLLTVSRLVARKGGNGAFFRGMGQSPWPMVAFGMIGASLSGVSLLSVPGMVAERGMTYLQMCLGFIPGYLAVAFLLLPIYYRSGRISIYGFIQERMGPESHRASCLLFLLSKLTGAAIRFYAAAYLLDGWVFRPMGWPFSLNALLMTMMIYLYTRRGGIRSLVFTDCLQTLCLLAALAALLEGARRSLGVSPAGALDMVLDSPMSRVFQFRDLTGGDHFLKQFLSGIFIVVVMTGMDQDLMQKNLTCKSLRDAQKDMCCLSLGFLPVNFLLLALGVLIHEDILLRGMDLPLSGDGMMADYAANAQTPGWVVILLGLGVTAASFSSADSALTSMTTVAVVDLLHREKSERARKLGHLSVSLLFLIAVLIFHALRQGDLLDMVYRVAGYTYGPLLGLFAFAMCTPWKVHDRMVPYGLLLSPALSGLADWGLRAGLGYRTGYEILLLNGAITFLTLLILRKK